MTHAGGVSPSDETTNGSIDSGRVRWSPLIQRCAQQFRILHYPIDYVALGPGAVPDENECEGSRLEWNLYEDGALVSQIRNAAGHICNDSGPFSFCTCEWPGADIEGIDTASVFEVDGNTFKGWISLRSADALSSYPTEVSFGTSEGCDVVE